MKTLAVIKYKRKERKRKQLNDSNETARMREESKYQAKMRADFNAIKLLMEYNKIDSVDIEVPENAIVKFTKALALCDMDEYNISQKNNVFRVKRVTIEL